MKEKSPARNRQRSSLPTRTQIARASTHIQATWSTREKQRRRVDKQHPQKDPRLQAHLRFIKFLVELQADNS